MVDLAEALAARGDTTHASAIVDEAVALSSRTGELLDLMKAVTFKGTLCAAASNDAAAVTCFEEAIALARKQAAKSMELRAAIAMSRLLQQQGRIAEARALLSDVYGWFTEGFDLPDLVDARTLLADFDQPVPGARAKASRGGRPSLRKA
jgi:tetratricopeptide (TPR) repeat protein